MALISNQGYLIVKSNIIFVAFSTHYHSLFSCFSSVFLMFICLFVLMVFFASDPPLLFYNNDLYINMLDSPHHIFYSQKKSSPQEC